MFGIDSKVILNENFCMVTISNWDFYFYKENQRIIIYTFMLRIRGKYFISNG